MAITRVTQNMMMERSLSSLQAGLSRLAKTQEQLSTGRILNRPSDSPTDTTAAMRLRSSLTDQTQYVRNAQDGLGWLGQIDNTILSTLDQVRKARDLALQGANSGTASPAAREALAAQVDQIRQGVLAAANTGYLGRPIFGGVTAGREAYDADGVYAGVAGEVKRTVADGVQIQVNVDGADVFGPASATVFDALTQLSADLRSGDTDAIRGALDKLDTAMDRMTTTVAEVGTKYARIESAIGAAKDVTLNMTASLSEIENVDLPRALVDLQMHEVAYQAALATTARVMQPSLLDFLR